MAPTSLLSHGDIFFLTLVDDAVHKRTGIFLPGGGVWGGGGGEPFAQKILSSCPNFYETVERKRGSYDALTMAYIWSENIFTYESIMWAQKTL